MNTAIIGQGSGIGFAVPSNLMKGLLPRLEKGEPITRGFLGVGIQDLTPEMSRALGAPSAEGAVVIDVPSGSPAHQGGIRTDDVVIAVDGQKVTNASVLVRMIGFTLPGKSVTLSVYRRGKPQELKITLGTRPEGPVPTEYEE
jgi:serine protease Do